MLGERLDAQIDEARDGIGRRVEQAGVEAQLQTLDDRYAMLRAEAAFDHNDPDKIESLAMVAEQAAAHEARLGGHDDLQSLATERRNAVWRSGIEANLAKGQPREALALYDRSKGSLGEALTTEMKDVATDVEAEDWVRRQEGAPTQDTADAALADPDLSPAARLRAYQKVQVEIAGRENARVAEVERLDASLDTATKALATDPSNFKRGTLASLADGYQKAGETDTAAMLRAQAEQESFLRGYAQSPAQAQQRILTSLPESVDRTLLEQIGKHQAEAFAKDPWSAGTSIYPDVGAPKPPSDLPGRMNQARLISKHRDGNEVLPFSGGEISTLRKNIPAAPPKEQTDTLKELATLPPEILPPLASALVGRNGSDDFQSRSLGGALSFHADGAPEIADQVLRGAKLTQEKGDAGKPVTATTDAWKDALLERIGDNAAVSPIVRDTIANIYTHNAERAGQGDEIDHDLLDKAIFITKGNISRQPQIMQMPYVISPDALNGGDSDAMLTPYSITPETLAEGDSDAVLVRTGPAAQADLPTEEPKGVGNLQGKAPPPADGSNNSVLPPDSPDLGTAPKQLRLPEEGADQQTLEMKPGNDRPVDVPTVEKMDRDPSLSTARTVNSGVPIAAGGGAGAAGGAKAAGAFGRAVMNVLRLAAPLALGPAALAALPLLLIPTNSGSEMVDLGPGLRARRRPGQRTVEIEKYTDSQWEKLPVPAEIVNGPNGQSVIGIDVDKLEPFVTPQAASRLRSQAVPAFPGQQPPPSIPMVVEMRIGNSADGGVTTTTREATEEEVKEFCKNYPYYQQIGLEASKRGEIKGLAKGPQHGLYVHKEAELEILKMAELKELMDELGIQNLEPEIALLEGVRRSYNLKNLSKLDVLEILRNKTICIYDFKTGKARFPEQTIRRYAEEAGKYVKREFGPGYDRIYVIPVRVP